MAGHRNWEGFHGGDRGVFLVPLLMFVFSRCSHPAVPAWIPAPMVTASMTLCCGQSNRGCPMIIRSHVWDRKERMGTVALPGISPVLSAPALAPLWLVLLRCHHSKLIQKGLQKGKRGKSHSLLAQVALLTFSELIRFTLFP